MTQLKTTFAGLSLRNPIIISSSSLTNSAEKNKKLELAGAGAIVLKSVFEEQIMMEAHHMATYGSPEGDDYLSTYVRSHALNEYISLIEQTKKLCTIPVIASINCFSNSEWTDFARTVEAAGADALEINILPSQTDFADERVQKLLKDFIEQALRHEARRLLPSRLLDLASRHGFTCTDVKIFNSKSHWGSCTPRRSINLSLSLMLLPWHLIDYVLLHELCHTIEMNHSDRFWALMDKVTEGKALELRKELKKYHML